MQRFEHKGGTSNKFWVISVDGKVLTVRFGAIGTNGQTKSKTCASVVAAEKERARLVAEKTKKGYRPASTSPKPSRAPAGKALPAAKAAGNDDGAPKDVLRIRKLALEAREGTEPLVRTYILRPDKKSTRGVARLGGPPIGVTEKTRPTFGGALMQHLVTLDLDHMPELRAHKRLARARAVALFISDADENDAYQQDTEETAVVVLSQADVERNEWTGSKVDDPKGMALASWPVDVPARVFAFDRFSDENDDDRDPLCILYDKLMSESRAGGPVIFFSGDEPRKDFLFQFTEDLVDVNLGDAGKMYVFERSAHWIGH